MQRMPHPDRSVKVLHLDIASSGDGHLKASLSSGFSADRDTLRPYEEAEVSLDGVTRRSQLLLETLNRANRKGRLTEKLLQTLKENGQLLRDELLTPQLKARLNASEETHLTISIEDRLVHIPWELLHDGRHFLCQRFSMGRIVRTRQYVPGPPDTPPNPGPLQVLILAGLDGSLPAARREGTEMRDLFESQGGDIRVMMRSANVDSEFLKTRIRRYDWVHFAGHADYDDRPASQLGWRLSDGWFTSEDAARMAGTGLMPQLVFANACQSARTSAWTMGQNRQRRLFGLVNALLLAGTRHFVGTTWEIPDEPGLIFARAFYRRLLRGATVGEAVGGARGELIDTCGEEEVIWASYVLYGDPTHRYLAPRQTPENRSQGPTTVTKNKGVASRSAMRASQQIEAQRDERPRKKPPLAAALLVGLTLGLVLLLRLVVQLPWQSGPSQQQQAQAAFREGDFKLVMDLCPSPDEGDQLPVECALLRGNVLFIQGDLAGAEALYERVSATNSASGHETAEAWIGLGRVAATRGDDQGAMRCYNRAVQAAPRRKAPLVSMAMLNGRLGNNREAIAYLDMAKEVSPSDDPAIDAMRHSLSEKLRLQGDAQRLARVDRLIDELTRPGQNSSSGRGGAQLPKGVWVLATETSGNSLREGASQMMTVLIENQLQGNGELTIVDRHLLDKILTELKIGTSPLTDRQTRLRLGRLQAVKLMVSGRMVFSGPETQVALRCIDTETSRVVAVVVAAFNTGQSFAEMARQVTSQLIEKLDQVLS